MTVALAQKGMQVECEKMVQVCFRGVLVGWFRTDLVLNDKVILELKTARTIDPLPEAQLLNDLKSTKYEVGLLFKFGPGPQFRRLRRDNEYKVPAPAAFPAEDRA